MRAGPLRTTIAGSLALTHTLFSLFGGKLLDKSKSRFKNHLVNKYQLRDRTLIADRYGIDPRILRLDPERLAEVIGLRPTVNHNSTKHYNNDEIKDRPLSDISKLKLAEKWQNGQYYIEAHNASHFHNDLSLICNGKVFRVARSPSLLNVKKGYLGLFPGPGERSSWIKQPEHFTSEVPNPSLIDDGYGTGTSKVLAKGNCQMRMSENGNMEVIFENFDGMYAFVEGNNKDILIVRKFNTGPAIGKHKLKAAPDKSVNKYIDDSNYIFVKKYNGSAVDWEVVKGANNHKYLKLYSWRLDKRLKKKYDVDAQIDHTYRTGIGTKKLPDDFPTCAGRAELWVESDNGLLELSTVLNSTVYNSLSEDNLKTPVLVIHDITKFEGMRCSSVAKLSYDKKLALIQHINSIDSRFVIPEYSDSSNKSKTRLWTKTEKKFPQYDGVIAWNINDPEERGVKIKFRHDEINYHNGIIIGFEPQTGIYHDKYAYPIICNEAGAEFKISGRGLTQEVKHQMFAHPEAFINKPVVYSAEHHFSKTDLPFQPILIRIETL